jgi:serine/threonine protein kinase
MKHVAAGELAEPKMTRAYASPETVSAYQNRQMVMVTAALDIWSLGVVVFEAFAKEPAVPPGNGDVCSRRAEGTEQYPWERTGTIRGFSDSRACEIVQACLARDPAMRPTAAELVQRLRVLSHR